MNDRLSNGAAVATDHDDMHALGGMGDTTGLVRASGSNESMKRTFTHAYPATYSSAIGRVK